MQKSSARVRWIARSARTIGAAPPKSVTSLSKRLCRPQGNRASRAVSPLSIQREHEQIARVLELVELLRMQVAAAGLHREILFRPDRIRHRRALERRADIETPKLFERLVVICNDPAVLQRREDESARGRDRA